MIELSHLQKVVDGRTVLDIAVLTIPDGQIAALVGQRQAPEFLADIKE